MRTVTLTSKRDRKPLESLSRVIRFYIHFESITLAVVFENSGGRGREGENAEAKRPVGRPPP